MTPEQLQLAREANELAARDTALQAAMSMHCDDCGDVETVLGAARQIYAFLTGKEVVH